MAAAASRLASASGLRGSRVARLVDAVPKEVADDIFSCAVKRQTGVSLKHMMSFGAMGNPDRQLLMSAQFLHTELPVRLAHRVAELENLPFGLSNKPHVLKVRMHACLQTHLTPAHRGRGLVTAGQGLVYSLLQGPQELQAPQGPAR